MTTNRYQCGHLVFDASRGCLLGGGQETRLTTKEAHVLAYLASRQGTTVSRDELLVEVWGYPRPVATRAVDNAIRRIRRKLGDDPRRPRVLFTVYGSGYRLQTSRGLRSDFFGRTEVLARLDQLWHEARTVQLVGLGGIGKTRLAQAHAQRWRQAGELVIWADGAQIPVQRLRVASGGVESARRRLLIVEDAPDDRAFRATLEALHAEEPELCVLLLRTQVCREAAWPTLWLTGLGVPAGVRLLRHAMDGAPEWTEAQLRQIVRLLDGHPAGLRLAAARSALLRPAELLCRLRTSAQVVAQAEPMLAASFRRLSQGQRRMLAQLAYLPGPVTVRLAEEIVDPGRVGATLDGLQALRDAALLERTSDGGVRVHQLVRLFAVQRWGGPEVEAGVSRRCLALAGGDPEVVADLRRAIEEGVTEGSAVVVSAALATLAGSELVRGDPHGALAVLERGMRLSTGAVGVRFLAVLRAVAGAQLRGRLQGAKALAEPMHGSQVDTDLEACTAATRAWLGGTSWDPRLAASGPRGALLAQILQGVAPRRG
ncbi:MAG: winged helix-turn-helix domain-containing protein [Myxococcales bacterium]|nr:winged helix-turn-helix domain-containing protein [Myxococcales bacterium]